MRTLLHLWTRIFRSRHRHNDVYHPRTVTGWGVVECVECGRTDLYT